MKKTICPRCGQDYLVKALIKPLGIKILISAECEAFWWLDEAITIQNFKDYGTFMESQGQTWDWDQLQIEET